MEPGPKPGGMLQQGISVRERYKVQEEKKKGEQPLGKRDGHNSNIVLRVSCALLPLHSPSRVLSAPNSACPLASQPHVAQAAEPGRQGTKKQADAELLTVKYPDAPVRDEETGSCHFAFKAGVRAVSAPPYSCLSVPTPTARPCSSLMSNSSRHKSASLASCTREEINGHSVLAASVGLLFSPAVPSGNPGRVAPAGHTGPCCPQDDVSSGNEASGDDEEGEPAGSERLVSQGRAGSESR